MRSLVRSIYLDSELGVPTDLDAAGTGLENPYVYDSVARDLKVMADEGLVKIVREQVRHGWGAADRPDQLRKAAIDASPLLARHRGSRSPMPSRNARGERRKSSRGLAVPRSPRGS